MEDKKEQQFKPGTREYAIDLAKKLAQREKEIKAGLEESQNYSFMDAASQTFGGGAIDEKRDKAEDFKMRQQSLYTDFYESMGVEHVPGGRKAGYNDIRAPSYVGEDNIEIFKSTLREHGFSEGGIALAERDIRVQKERQNLETKERMAQDELKNTLGPGILALTPDEQQNFVELPKQDQLQTATETGTVLNNFNVNVNVSGGSQTNAQKVASESLKKALPTTNESPEQIKKNSVESSKTNSQEGSNKKEPVLGALQDKQEESPEYVEIPDSVGPTIPALDLAGLGMFETGDMSPYDYSTSRLKEENASVKMSYAILKNVVQHSMQDQNIIEISPQTNIDQSMMVQEIAGARQFYNVSELNVEKNSNQTIQTVNELSRQKERQDKNISNENNRYIQSLVENKKRELSQEDDDVKEATTLERKMGNGQITSIPEPVRTLQHLNPVPSTIPMFMTKMNSPPYWRTALG